PRLPRYFNQTLDLAGGAVQLLVDSADSFDCIEARGEAFRGVGVHGSNGSQGLERIFRLASLREQPGRLPKILQCLVRARNRDQSLAKKGQRPGQLELNVQSSSR